MHILHTHTEAGDAFAVDGKFQVRLTDNAISDHVGGTWDGAQNIFHLQTDALNFFQILTINLHAHHGAKSGLQHNQARLYRLQPGWQNARQRRGTLEFGKDLALGDASLLWSEPRQWRLQPARP